MNDNLSDDKGRQLAHWQLRRLMGVPEGKLPEGSGTYKIGNITVVMLTRDEAARRAPKSVRPHRVLAGCPQCLRLVGAGKFHQHLRGCKGIKAGQTPAGGDY